MAIQWYPENTHNLWEYLGKDAWVKCYNKRDDYPCYIKVERISQLDESMQYYEVAAFIVDERILEMYTRDEAMESMEYLHTGYTWDFEILSPYDYATTEEIVNSINSCDAYPF
jgi:hypothetical protein